MNEGLGELRVPKALSCVFWLFDVYFIKEMLCIVFGILSVLL